MYNLIEYSYNYSKTSRSLWQYYRNEPNKNLTNSESFKFKTKITGKAPTDGNTKDVEIIVPLKYLSTFWRTFGMSLINCEVNLILTWSLTCVITNSTGAGRFAITDTKLYRPVVTLSFQDNAKLLQQLKSDFKRKITLHEKYRYSELFWCECGKMRTGIPSNRDNFYAVLTGTNISQIQKHMHKTNI